MRWLVEITDITDNRFLTDLLTRLNITLFPEENRIYLISDNFDSLSTCFEIWTRVNQVRDIVSEISSGFGAGVGFQLGTVYEQKEDGSRHGTVFRSGVAPILELSAGGGTWTVTPEISEAEKLRLEAERLEREYQDKLALVSSRVLAALRDERALKVHRFLQQELTPLRMGHIMDLIKEDLGGSRPELKNFISNSTFIDSGQLVERFYYSINYSEGFGDDARHITELPTTNRRPKNMSPSETRIFISSVANLWFEWKCIDDSNA